MHWWEAVLTHLEGDPLDARQEVDWVAKLAVLQGYQDRYACGWDDPRLRAIDIQWSDVRGGKGIFHTLEAGGRYVRLVAEDDVVAAVTTPPEDTRAWFRGQCLAKFPTEVVAASWDSVIFDLPGAATMQRVPTLDPHRGTRAHVGAIIDAAPDATSLLAGLASVREAPTAPNAPNAPNDPNLP